jgi:hypothetical protein
VGIVIALAFQKSSLVETGKSTINPAIDLTFGALLIALSVVLHTGRDKPVRERRAERKARKGPKKPPRWQRVLSKGDPKIAVVIGALLTLPGASYLAALDSIAKLSYSDAVTVLLVLMVNVIMLALLEVPLICFAVAPEWTPTMIERVKDAFRRRGRHVLTVGLAVVGSLIALRGLITIFS